MEQWTGKNLEFAKYLIFEVQIVHNLYPGWILEKHMLLHQVQQKPVNKKYSELNGENFVTSIYFEERDPNMLDW